MQTMGLLRICQGIAMDLSIFKSPCAETTKNMQNIKKFIEILLVIQYTIIVFVCQSDRSGSVLPLKMEG